MKFLLGILFLALTACQTAPPAGDGGLSKAVGQVLKGAEAVPLATPPPRIALYWENTTAPHTERMVWSDAVIAAFKADLPTFAGAKDITVFCPKFGVLSEDQKLKALGEFWVAVAYYESGFNPKSASVDVGTKDNKDTWSVGLYQMSVTDQKNYGFPFGFDYDDLQTPLPNIKLALAVLKKQVASKGLLAIPAPQKGVYWAVLRPGGKFDKSAKIAERVKKYASFCQ
jgi:hypothetical protein